MIEIEEITPGEGREATEGDTIDVHYTGMFVDGTKFDSSKDRGATFPVTIGRTGLIQGFTMGLIGMKQGGVRKITIPPELGYGERGAPGAIPPNSTLVFELELVKLH
jgi:FKBP-type peptidyl-prolyl cis-trans isomerase